jgi:hypothetical protein
MQCHDQLVTRIFACPGIGVFSISPTQGLIQIHICSVYVPTLIQSSSINPAYLWEYIHCLFCRQTQFTISYKCVYIQCSYVAIDRRRLRSYKFCWLHANAKCLHEIISLCPNAVYFFLYKRHAVHPFSHAFTMHTSEQYRQYVFKCIYLFSNFIIDLPIEILTYNDIRPCLNVSSACYILYNTFI